MSVSTWIPWGRWSPGRVNSTASPQASWRLPQVLTHTSQTEDEVSWISEGDCASCVLSRFSCVRLCVILWTVAHRYPLFMGFSKREYWSGLLCPLPRNLPEPGIEPVSLTSTCIGRGVRLKTIKSNYHGLMSAKMLENPRHKETVGSFGPISGLLRKKPGGSTDLWDSLDMQHAPSAGFKGTQRNPYNRPWDSMMEVFQGLHCQQGVLMVRTDFLVIPMNDIQATNTSNLSS